MADSKHIRKEADALTDRRKSGRSNYKQPSTQYMNKVKDCMEKQYTKEYALFLKIYGTPQEFWEMVRKEMEWYLFEFPANQCEFLIIKYKPLLIAMEK